MASLLPTNFPELPPSSIATYDYVDLSEGTGQTTFFGTVAEDDGATTHLLTTSADASAVVDTQQLNAGTTTLTFNSAVFNLPRFVKGTAYFSAGIENNVGTGDNVTVQLFHYDGSTATAMTAKKTLTFSAGSVNKNIYIELPITTEKLVAIGHNVRMVVELVVPGSGGDYLAIGHDPLDTDGSFITPSSEVATTIMKVRVPFRIDN